MKAPDSFQFGEFLLAIFGSKEFIAAAILVVGFAVALVVRIVLVRLSDRIGERGEGYFKSFELAFRRAGPIAFWTILIVSVLWSFQVLEIAREWEFYTLISDQVPRIVLAIAIVLLAHFLGIAVRDIVRRTIHDTRIARPSGTIAYIVVLLTGLIVAFQQFGIDISVVGIGMLVVAGAFLVTLGLSFAVGAQHHIANLIARQELTRLNVGDRIRIDDVEGTVADIQRTRVILVTNEGTASVPAARFSQSVAEVLSETK
ncbi:MAG: mechanosensitive ion channel [Gammaproteobacteria bacterium]|nr:mechanosensitive ion channel [Gammaproteobacteria bacterium]